jgi:hypothetical protein
MVEAFRCSQCSAPVEDDRWTNCSYCGAVLAKPTINPLRAAVAPERFTAVERSPGYEALLRRKPSGTGKLFGMAFQTAFLLVFIVVSGSMTVAFPAGPFAFVPGFLCAAGIYLLVRTSSRAARFAGAVLERRVAVWKDERTQVSGGGEHSSASTSHYVLLEERDGKRTEVPCDKRLAGAHAPGDIGIAYLRGGVLLDFQRVDA